MSETAENIIKIEESFRSKEYYCSEGYPTIGYGEKVGEKGEPLSNRTTTKPEALKFLREEIQKITIRLATSFPQAWARCNPARQAILISMVYQLGLVGVTKFTKMLEALKIGDFELAAKEMLDSKWAKQTPNRAKRHSEQMRMGSIHMYYLTNGEM